MPKSKTKAPPQGRYASTLVLMISLVTAIFAFQLNATADAIALSQTVFFSAAALFSLFLPRLGDLMGRRKIMCAMLILTAAGCVLSALAPNITMLLVGRLLQGASGPIVPLCLIILRIEITDPRRYATLLGVLTSINGGIAGVDALLGGWLASSFGFRSIFWTMAGVCLAATILVACCVRNSIAAVRPKMDWTGVVLLVATVGALLTAINEAGKVTKANWLLVGGLMIMASVAGLVFWRAQEKSSSPLVPPEYARHRSTWAVLLTTVLTMTGVFSVLNGLLPALAQDEQIGAGIGAGSVSWYTLTPYAIAGLIVGPIAGRVAGKIGFAKVLRFGQAATVVGLVFAATSVANPTGLVLLGVSTLIGITYAGICNIMLNGIGVLLSPKSSPGYLPGLNAGAFNLGAGLSFALLYAVHTVVDTQIGASAGYVASFITGAVFLALAFGTGLLIPKPEDSTAGDEISETATGHDTPIESASAQV